MDQTFNIAIYNIHGCVGTDRRFDPERIARVIEEMNCAVIGLQEVSSLRPDEEQMEFLAEATGFHASRGLPC